jgi:transposase
MRRKKQYKRYSPEFKKQALQRAAEEDVTDVQVCRELGISARQLRRWRDEVRLHGENAFPGKGHSRDEEVTQLKRQLAKVKRERDVLREAAACFAKESK